eukprot:3804836-Amphidinium_carterae.1
MLLLECNGTMQLRVCASSALPLWHPGSAMEHWGCVLSGINLQQQQHGHKIENDCPNGGTA